LKPSTANSSGNPFKGFNRLKTLSGIETETLERIGKKSKASTDSKPFQGLKLRKPFG